MSTLRFLFALFALFAVTCLGWSQTAKTRTDLYTEINTLFADTGETAITPADVRTSLKNIAASSYNGLTDGAPASTYQPLDSELTALAALTTTSFGRSLLELADASAGRTALGLVIGTNVQAYDADLTTFAGISPTANVQTLLGAADYAAFRTSLGLVIGTNVQAYDADLTTYAGITPAANVQSLLGAADYSAMRTLLGLVIGTNVQAYDADLTTYAGITPAANVQSLLGAANYAAMRALLDLEAGTDFLAYPTGTPTGSKYLRDDNTWQTIAGGGDAQTANPLTQFSGILPTNTEFNYVDGVTSSIQTQLDAKLATSTAASTYQPLDSDLTSLAALTTTSHGRGLLDDADAAASRTSIGVVIGTDVQAYDADLTTWGGKTAPSGTVVGTSDTQTLAAKTIELTAAHGSDDTLTGTTVAGLNAGATIAQWEAVYLGGSSTWLLADANGSGTYPARGLAITSGTSSNPLTVLVSGTVRNDAWAWTPGGTIYLSTTAGGLTQTAPSTSADKVQQVGTALTADIAHFNFASGEYLTVE